MNSVELVKRLCKEKGIPISRMERECGFANGYVRRLKGGAFPSNRVQVIADYLGIPVSDLLNGTCENELNTNQEWYLDPETAKAAQEVFDDPETRMLFDAARNASPEAIRLAAEMLKTFKKTNPDG